MTITSVQRVVSIVEIDSRIDAKDAYEANFIQDGATICQARLEMGSDLLSLTQHWLEHHDDLFADVFSRLER